MGLGVRRSSETSEALMEEDPMSITKIVNGVYLSKSLRPTYAGTQLVAFDLLALSRAMDERNWAL